MNLVPLRMFLDSFQYHLYVKEEVKDPLKFFTLKHHFDDITDLMN